MRRVSAMRFCIWLQEENEPPFSAGRLYPAGGGLSSRASGINPAGAEWNSPPAVRGDWSRGKTVSRESETERSMYDGPY